MLPGSAADHGAQILVGDALTHVDQEPVDATRGVAGAESHIRRAVARIQGRGGGCISLDFVSHVSGEAHSATLSLEATRAPPSVLPHGFPNPSPHRPPTASGLTWLASPTASMRMSGQSASRVREDEAPTPKPPVPFDTTAASAPAAGRPPPFSPDASRARLLPRNLLFSGDLTSGDSTGFGGKVVPAAEAAEERWLASAPPPPHDRSWLVPAAPVNMQADAARATRHGREVVEAEVWLPFEDVREAPLRCECRAAAGSVCSYLPVRRAWRPLGFAACCRCRSCPTCGRYQRRARGRRSGMQACGRLASGKCRRARHRSGQDE